MKSLNMKRSFVAAAALAVLATMGPVRARTLDVAYNYRMGAGFPGDVNRTHPASILPGNMSTASPVRLYGDPVLIDTATNTYRSVNIADLAITKVDGILVRPYPVQQTTGGMNASIGAAVPPVGPAVIDVLNEGFIIAKCNNFGANPPTKGGAVYIWCAASAGNHVLGGFEAAATGGSTAGPITNLKWNGPTDASGITEIQVAAPMA